jgi:hypothetical protein
MKKRFRIVLFMLILLKVNTVCAQAVDYSVHANIIYRFTKYIEWPQETKSGEFVIGFVGDSPLFELLQESTKNKTAGMQKISVRKFTAVEISYHCEILIISEEESSMLKRIATVTEGTPVLLVTESEGLSRKGSCINFSLEDDHLELEFNKNNLDARKLRVASELLSLGKVIEETKNKTSK